MGCKASKLLWSAVNIESEAWLHHLMLLDRSATEAVRYSQLHCYAIYPPPTLHAALFPFELTTTYSQHHPFTASAKASASMESRRVLLFVALVALIASASAANCKQYSGMQAGARCNPPETCCGQGMWCDMGR